MAVDNVVDSANMCSAKCWPPSKQCTTTLETQKPKCSYVHMFAHNYIVHTLQKIVRVIFEESTPGLLSLWYIWE